MKAIRASEFGGPEVLKLVDLPEPPSPQPGEVLARVKAAGVNPSLTCDLAPNQTESRNHSIFRPFAVQICAESSQLKLGDFHGAVEQPTRLRFRKELIGGSPELDQSPTGPRLSLPKGVPQTQLRPNQLLHSCPFGNCVSINSDIFAR